MVLFTSRWKELMDDPEFKKERSLGEFDERKLELTDVKTEQKQLSLSASLFSPLYVSSFSDHLKVCDPHSPPMEKA